MAVLVQAWGVDSEPLTGWKRWFVVAGGCTSPAPTSALLADQIGIDTGAGLSGARSLNIPRADVRAFFDQLSRCYPEVMLCRRGEL